MIKNDTTIFLAFSVLGSDTCVRAPKIRIFRLPQNHTRLHRTENRGYRIGTRRNVMFWIEDGVILVC